MFNIIIGLHRSSTKEDILKLGCMTSEELEQTCREFSQKVYKHPWNMKLHSCNPKFSLHI